MPAICYLGLGSNIGNSNQNLLQAIQLIANINGIKVTQQASFYLSKAWGKTDQDNFVNTVIEIECQMTAEQLFVALQQIEKQMGRTKQEKWGPRIIDIDILTFADDVVNLPHLHIPHPYLTQRSFVLAPLYELNPHLMIATQGHIKTHIQEKQIKQDILTKYML